MGKQEAGEVSDVRGKARRLTQRDLEWLRCPVCHSLLAMLEAEDQTPTEVRCTSCGRGYPFVDGLLVLLANRATRYI